MVDGNALLLSQWAMGRKGHRVTTSLKASLSSPSAVIPDIQRSQSNEQLKGLTVSSVCHASGYTDHKASLSPLSAVIPDIQRSQSNEQLQGQSVSSVCCDSRYTEITE